MLEKYVAWHECDSAEAMIAEARELATMLPADCTLAFHGDLGAGKTTFVRGLAEAFHVKEQVTSPSYNIYAIYDGEERQLIHMDAYRLADSSQLDALMLEEFMKSPWCLVIEWPEKISDALPPNSLHFFFEITPSGTHRFRIGK